VRPKASSAGLICRTGLSCTRKPLVDECIDDVSFNAVPEY